MKNDNTSVPCAICGDEHDPEEIPEIDSTHLCAACAAAERSVRQLLVNDHRSIADAE